MSPRTPLLSALGLLAISSSLGAQGSFTQVDGRYAFVNNTFSHDVSVIALPEKEVIARIPVGEIPIVMGVHPA